MGFSGSLDFNRLGKALQRPGIDPRVWVSVAIVTSEVFVDVDAEDNSAGVFVDVEMLPSGIVSTARVGSNYVGTGAGIYTPIKVADEVLVVAPSGDPNEGLVLAQRLWSPSDPPPQEAADHPEDLVLVVEQGKNMRLKLLGEGSVLLDIADGGGLTVNVAGSGDVNLNVDSGTVKLGSESATAAVGRVGDAVSAATSMVTWIAAVSTFINGLAPATVVPPTDFGAIAAGADKVVAS